MGSVDNPKVISCREICTSQHFPQESRFTEPAKQLSHAPQSRTLRSIRLINRRRQRKTKKESTLRHMMEFSRQATRQATIEGRNSLV
ncbi:ABC transporter ATP-binding protein [Sesbania bispinosa]|nr:ABC transporter ATP-binding protein [Sesbania bispinosa]